ncbi:MAG: hypothetical protein AAGI12_04335 [Pseudomonadota bacterium]
MLRTLLTGYRDFELDARGVVKAVGSLPAVLPIAGAAVLAAVITIIMMMSGDLGVWVHNQAHVLGHAVDNAVAAVARGDAGAWTMLLGGSALYGFLHALGPGHGKVLVAGVGAGSSVTAKRLMGLSLAAGVAQAVWAILLVYGALTVLSLSIGAVTGLANDVLAPLGAALIACIGGLLLWRTLKPKARLWMERLSSSEHDHGVTNASKKHNHSHQHSHAGSCSHSSKADTHGGEHQHGHDCGCSHAPSADAVAKLEKPWDAITLVAGIAVRPCTSALLILALSWQAGVPFAGALATLAMGLGTATLICMIAGSSVLARRMALAGSSETAVRAHFILRILVGATLVIVGLTMVSTVF